MWAVTYSKVKPVGSEGDRAVSCREYCRAGNQWGEDDRAP